MAGSPIFLYVELDHSVLDGDVVAVDRALRFGKAFAACDVELPAVEFAFDRCAAEFGIGKRIAFVGAEILDGEETAADIKKSDLAAVL